MKAVKISLLIIVLFLVSCDMSVQNSSFTAKLDECDKFISQLQYEEAYKLLINLETKASSVYQFLGITKRYIRMSDNLAAEKVLKKAYRKNSNSNEIRAVYSWVLLKNQNIDMAVIISENLKNTNYSGLYSQARIEKAKLEKTDFLTENFQEVYNQAYSSSGLIEFIQNAACYECSMGNFDQAMQYHPENISTYDNIEFWSLVAYDSSNFLQAIRDAEILANNGEKGKAYLISADCYIKMNEIALAKKEWEKALQINPLIDPNLLMNCTYAALETGDFKNSYYYITSLVDNYPEYIPGLVLYGKFALNDMNPKAEDSFAVVLRQRGIKSLDMEYLDSKIKIPVSDVLFRMESVNKKLKSPELDIEYLKLKWISEKDITKEDKVIDVWNMIEKNYGILGTNDEKISDFLISFFIKNDMFEDAEKILSSVVKEKYQIDDYLTVINKLSVNEKIYVSYIQLQKGNYNQAKTLLNECYNSGHSFSADFYLNLGNLFESSGDVQKAMEVYSKGASIQTNSNTKSEFYFRIANLYLGKNDIKNAKLHIGYAITLNPGHVKARLLQKKLLSNNL